jgi:hypothetical protein
MQRKKAIRILHSCSCFVYLDELPQYLLLCVLSHGKMQRKPATML